MKTTGFKQGDIVAFSSGGHIHMATVTSVGVELICVTEHGTGIVSVLPVGAKNVMKVKEAEDDKQ